MRVTSWHLLTLKIEARNNPLIIMRMMSAHITTQPKYLVVWINSESAGSCIVRKTFLKTVVEFLVIHEGPRPAFTPNPKLT